MSYLTSQVRGAPSIATLDQFVASFILKFLRFGSGAWFEANGILIPQAVPPGFCTNVQIIRSGQSATPAAEPVSATGGTLASPHPLSPAGRICQAGLEYATTGRDNCQ